MPVTLAYDVQEQVVMIPFEAMGCANFVGTVVDIHRMTCCVPDQTGGTLVKVGSTKYTVQYWARIHNVCAPATEQECVLVCKDFCENELRPLTTTP
ncbi:MAG: hypothetical protein K0U41_02345 [Gammaproteobacteria bacterium]|nr:hypothetical protein [Gammaproteobacteria bacterium]